MAYQPLYGGPAPPQQQQPGGYPQGYPPQQQPGGYPQGYPPQQQPGGYPQGYPPQQPQIGAYGVPAPAAAPHAAPPPPVQPMAAVSDPSLRTWFDAVDQDRTGRINTRELQAALSSGGFEFNLVTADKLIRMFDRDSTGTLNFVEFGELHQFVNTMVAAFRVRDSSGDGLLSASEIRTALQASGYQLNEPTIQLMMRKFDRKHIGGLALDDYIELSVLISSARNVFNFYDKHHTGQVTFNFDSFVTAALTLR